MSAGRAGSPQRTARQGVVGVPGARVSWRSRSSVRFAAGTHGTTSSRWARTTLRSTPSSGGRGAVGRARRCRPTGPSGRSASNGPATRCARRAPRTQALPPARGRSDPGSSPPRTRCGAVPPNSPGARGRSDAGPPPRPLASVTALVPSVGGGWELALDSLRDDPSWLPDRAWRLGEMTAELHGALASLEQDPAFRPEEPSAEALGLLAAAIDEEIAMTFATLPDDDALAAVAHRAEDLRDLVQEMVERSAGLSIGRTATTTSARCSDDRRRLGRDRLRGRARAVAPRAATEALAAPRPRRDDAVVRVRRGRVDASERRRAAPGMARHVPRGVPRRLPLHRGRAPSPAEPRRLRPPSRTVRAREARLRAPLRGPEPAGWASIPLVGLLRLLKTPA
jgi:hypothetical protein